MTKVKLQTFTWTRTLFNNYPMRKEFIPYEQAILLKNLGFDEPCLAFYNEGGYLVGIDGVKFDSDHLYVRNSTLSDSCACPLFSQAFRFLMQRMYWHIIINNPNGLGKTKGFGYEISVRNSNEIVAEYPSSFYARVSEPWLETYEEAEQACLKKAIELCLRDPEELHDEAIDLILKYLD